MSYEPEWENRLAIDLEVAISNIDCNRKHLSPAMNSMLIKLYDAYQEYENLIKIELATP
jgi:hypothetical protein